MGKAVVGAVAALVLAAGCGNAATLRAQPAPSASPPVPIATASPAPSLSALLDDLNLPPDAKPATSSARGDWGLANSPFAEDPGYTHRVGYWTTSLSPAAAKAIINARPVDGLTGAPSVSDSFERPETAAVYGPQLDVLVDAAPGGGSQITAVSWQDVKPAKTADEVVPSGVTSVDVAIWVYQSTKPMVTSLSGATAQQLANDVNALWVKVTPVNAGCGGSIYTATSFTLTFHTPGGTRTLSTGCNTVAPDGDSEAPLLYDSPALDNELQRDFGRFLPAPYIGSSAAAAPPTSSTSPPSAGDPRMIALLDQIPVPADVVRVAAPADGEVPGWYGYSDQPGYRSAVRYWTTSLTPDKIIAGMTTHPFAGMTGGPEGPHPNKGPADDEADYRAKDSASLIGPRLELYAVALPDGRTAVHAFAREIDNSAKPANDRITGDVTSVTGTSPAGSSTVKSDKAEQLVRDFNALLIAAHPSHCGPDVFSLALTFHTSTGDVAATDQCGYVQIRGRTDVLETSNAFNLDVNHDFVALLPTPLPSSAPLPTNQVTPRCTAGSNTAPGAACT